MTSEHQAHSWVAFHQGETVAVLCTLSLPARGAPAPVFVRGGPKPTDIAAFEAEVRDLVLQTYRVDAGEDGLPPVVVGRITSSEGLTLDPRKVASLAAGSLWVVEAEKVKGGQEVRETLERMAIPFVERPGEDSSLPPTLTTVPLTAEQAEALWAAIRVEDEPVFRVSDRGVPNQEVLDDLLDDILALAA